ncbi:MAG: AAA family ATPase [Proteobacteria bacterium]|nr:AAA family ATPase [Pseudomonadota bacterium]
MKFPRAYSADGQSALAKRLRPIILDKVQKAPRLFDEIKRLVDLKKRPGEFILTGSSGFSSKIGIRESLLLPINPKFTSYAEEPNRSWVRSHWERLSCYKSI